VGGGIGVFFWFITTQDTTELNAHSSKTDTPITTHSVHKGKLYYRIKN
jgi:hypothetical protein